MTSGFGRQVMDASQILLETPSAGGAPTQRHGIRRLTAAAAALALNAPLWFALNLPNNGSRHFRSEPSQTLVVFFADSSKTARAYPENPQPRMHHHTPRPQHAGLEIPPGNGPPTETREYIASHSVPDGEAVVRGAPSLRALCLRTYPVELTSDVAASAEIRLRVFVMPDGRIGQGTVVNSSGNERLDLLTLKCLQANGVLEVHSEESMSNGSWQRLTWQWSLP
jgi:hypothetical protein